MKIIITEDKLKELSKGWTERNGKLVRKYKFDNYEKVMDFVNVISRIAKKQNHHPDVKFGYDYVEISIFDHEKNKISDRCYKFIGAVNNLK